MDAPLARASAHTDAVIARITSVKLEGATLGYELSCATGLRAVGVRGSPLPGGVGTVDAFTSVVDWASVGLVIEQTGDVNLAAASSLARVCLPEPRGPERR